MRKTWFDETIMGDFWPVGVDWMNESITPDEVMRLHKEMGFSSVRLVIFDYLATAYYPSKVWGERRPVGDRDLYQEALDACRKYGLKTAVYIHVGGVSTELRDAHPDWAEIDAEGQFMNTGWGGALGEPHWHMCINRGYADFVMALIDEVMSYGPDGFYVDGPTYLEQCYCPNCRSKFKQDTGQDLPERWPPTDEDMDNPLYHTLIQWRYDLVAKFFARMVERVKSHADVPVFFNGYSYPSSLRRFCALLPERVAPFVEGMLNEAGVISSGRQMEEIAERVKFTRALGLRPISYVENCVWGWPVPAAPAAELRVKIAEVLACGGRPIFFPTLNLAYDYSGVEGAKDILRLFREKQDWFVECEPSPAFGLVFSRQTNEFYGKDHKDTWTSKMYERYERGYQGMFRAVGESQVPFRVVLDEHLTKEGLRDYRALILSNVACLSEAQMEALSAFVEKGGLLVATYDTSLFDEAGRKRADFGLRKLFGASYVASESNLAACFHIPGAHELVKDFPRATLDPQGRLFFPLNRHTVIRAENGIGRVHEKSRVQRGLQIGRETDSPALTLQEHGQGVAVYLAVDLGEMYHDHGFEILRKLLARLLFLGSPPPVQIRAPKTVRVHHLESANREKTIVALVNHTYLRGSARDQIDAVAPLDNLHLDIECEGAEEVRLNTRAIDFQKTAKGISVQIPRLEEYAFLFIRSQPMRG